MRNPITQTRNHLALYLLFWTVVALLYGLGLYQTQDLWWGEVAVTAGVRTLSFAFAGLIVWFVVRYAGLGAVKFWNVLINHVAAAALLVALWLVVSHTLVSLLLGQPVALAQVPRQQLGTQAAAGLVGYALVAINYYLLIYYQGYRSQQVSELEMKNVLRETELSMLKSQLNPHFLFNSLNSISSLTLTRPEAAHEMVVKLAAFLRYTLSHPETELVTLQQELETTRLYLDIEMLRFGDRLSTEWHGVDALPESIRLPHLLLQPLVENAIKHGVYERLEGSTLRLHAAMEGEELVLTLTNPTGDRPKQVVGGGIGLQNVRRRLAHHYHRQDLIRAQQLGDLYSVTLRIPQIS